MRCELCRDYAFVCEDIVDTSDCRTRAKMNFNGTNELRFDPVRLCPKRAEILKEAATYPFTPDSTIFNNKVI